MAIIPQEWIQPCCSFTTSKLPLPPVCLQAVQLCWNQLTGSKGTTIGLGF